MSQLIIVQDRKPKQVTASDESAKAIRRQADKVLELHGADLPPEIVAMLKSPFIHIVNQALADIKPWLAEQVAARKQGELRNHPDYETVRDLLARGNFVLTGQFADIIKSKIRCEWMLPVLQMDTLEVLSANQLKGLRMAVELVERMERTEKAAVAPKPQPPKSTKPASKGKKRPNNTKDPILRVITAEKPRERRSKAKKSVTGGLPPVKVGKVDWSQGEAKSHELGKPNPMGLDAGQKRTGAAVPNAGKSSKQLAAKRGAKG